MQFSNSLVENSLSLIQTIPLTKDEIVEMLTYSTCDCPVNFIALIFILLNIYISGFMKTARNRALLKHFFLARDYFQSR